VKALHKALPSEEEVEALRHELAEAREELAHASARAKSSAEPKGAAESPVAQDAPATR
jgi:hypothetical protein